jgi:hypothetical protein
MAAAIPAIDLPPLNDIVNRPPQPRNPPDAEDLVAGYMYEKDMLVAHGMRNQHDSYNCEYLHVFRSIAEGLVGDGPLADSFTYQLNLVQAKAGAGVFNSLAVFSSSSRLI